METKQVTVQPAVGGMIKASKDSFVIPKEELKDFYLKFAFLLNPDSCSINRTEFELLNILLKDLKKILAALTHLNTHPWDEGIAEIQISCGVYSLQDNLSKKERMQMNTSMGKHLQFLTQMAVNSPVFKLLFKNYHKTIISKWKVWLNRWLKKSTNSNNKNRSWRINRGGTFRKTHIILRHQPIKK